MPFRNSILAATVLLREAIQSPNYVTGVSGWIIRQDGTAEFADLVIRSSDGSGSTVIIANGVITIKDGSSNTVTTISADGYQLFDSSGVLIVEISKDVLGGGVWTRGFQSPENISAFLGGGTLEYRPVTNGVVDLSALVQYDTDGTTGTDLILDSGAVNSTDKRAKIIVESAVGAARGAVFVTGDGSDKADLDVDGSLTAGNFKSGQAQAPAPGAVPAQTSVSVTFASAFPATPHVVVTPNSSSANLNGANIRLAVTGITTTGFTVNCWRDTNNATNIEWFAHI